MPEYLVEKCDNWDGRGRVCDLYRCKPILAENNGACYHKPITINGERHTVVGALDRILGESADQENIVINGEKLPVLRAIMKIMAISQK